MPFFFSSKDVRVLRQLIDWWKASRFTHYKKDVEKHKFQSPDVYIAKPLSSGITGLIEASGTSDNDTPGKGQCILYRIDSSDNLELYSGPLFKTEVYNLSREAIPETYNGVDQNWILVVRSKQGKWIAQPVRGFDRCNATLKGAITSSGTGSVTFTVDNVVATRGATPVSGSSEELTVDNFFGWDANDNANCKIEYNHNDNTWECYQVDCPT